MEEKKIIVAHFGKQHSYRLAETLKENGQLQKYITTVYLKKNNFTAFSKVFLKGNNLKRVETRKCSGLLDKEVKQFCELGGLINLILIRIDKSQKIYIMWSRFIAKRFAKKVAKYAIKNNPDAVIMYDTNAKYCFEILEKKAPHIKRILDVSSATHRYMKKIYEEDIIRNPKYAKSIKDNCKYFWDDKTLKRYDKEIQLTHHFLVPSEFVKKSIEYHKINSKKISICPYGVDISKFIKKDLRTEERELRCVYIGGINQRKGISYLIEAMSSYDRAKVSLTLVGKYDEKDNNLIEYFNKYDFKGLVTHDEVARICSESDIMIFPSLSEGLSLAILEGLGSSLPVITTENSGFHGIIKNKYNGFLVPVGNSQAIKNKVDWFLENRKYLTKMKNNARDTAIKYTWNNYNEIIINEINKILKE